MCDRSKQIPSDNAHVTIRMYSLKSKLSSVTTFGQDEQGKKEEDGEHNFLASSREESIHFQAFPVF